MFRKPSTLRPYTDEDAPLNPLLPLENMQSQSPHVARLTRHLTWLNEGSRSLHRIAFRSLRRTLAFFHVASVVGFFISGGIEVLTGGWADLLDITVAVAISFAFMAVFYLGLTIIFDSMTEFRLLGLYIVEGESGISLVSPLSTIDECEGRTVDEENVAGHACFHA